jgi:hypothetical protein
MIINFQSSCQLSVIPTPLELNRDLLNFVTIWLLHITFRLFDLFKLIICCLGLSMLLHLPEITLFFLL